MSFLSKLREKKNLLLYDSRQSLLNGFQALVFFAAFFSLGICVIYFLLPQSDISRQIQLFIIKFTITIFVINYLLRLEFSKPRKVFLKKYLLESILVLFILLDAAAIIFLNFYFIKFILNHLELDRFYDSFYFVFILLYILFVVGYELFRFIPGLYRKNINPITVWLGIYIVCITIGFILYLLPGISSSEQNMDFRESLFLTVGNITLSGFKISDPANLLSSKGQILLLILVQMGGLLILTFTTSIATYLSSQKSIRLNMLLEDFIYHKRFGVRNLFVKVLIYSLIAELAGACLIYFLWPDSAGLQEGTPKRIFYSIFHAVSAFCNAGYTLFPNSLSSDILNVNYVLQLAFIFLMILGGLGYFATVDLLSIPQLRNRLRNPWKKWKIETTIAVYSTGIILIIGTLVIYLLERNHAYVDLKPIESLIAGFFHTASSRTCGMYTIPIDNLQIPTLLFSILFMFIGASACSTGGGIKTYGMFILLLASYSNIKNHRYVEFQKRQISNAIIKTVFIVFIVSLLVIFMASVYIAMLHPAANSLSIIFDVTSAYSNTGLSSGIIYTISLSEKMIFAVISFIGRFLPVALVYYAMTSTFNKRHYKYTDTNLMVG